MSCAPVLIRMVCHGEQGDGWAQNLFQRFVGLLVTQQSQIWRTSLELTTDVLGQSSAIHAPLWHFVLWDFYKVLK